ncbi:SAP domain-containing protein [Streptomyces antibioticus]|uniref:SAP domain-containing protein n=1 Tax=Streptomyces antibioticus TaxID=1890 RepID=UPI0036F90787
MDYEQMSVQELREACQARGLGTARSRADLIQRLAGHDARRGPEDTVQAPIGSPEFVIPASFTTTFPAEPDGPDEETHLAHRQATIQAAAAAGLVPRGDARRAATRDGVWVYEVSVRRGVPS